MNEEKSSSMSSSRCRRDSIEKSPNHVTTNRPMIAGSGALLVELGEFANETRCFKFWSLKPASPKEVVILDEYADGMHFFLSLGIPLGVTTFSHRYKIREKDLSRAIVGVYKAVGALHEHYDPEHYGVAFGAYLNLGKSEFSMALSYWWVSYF
jgi:dimeric dUTPase (all-alpha-NTP-PPase superfamily)